MTKCYRKLLFYYLSNKLIGYSYCIFLIVKFYSMKNKILITAAILLSLVLVFRGCFYDPTSIHAVGDFFEMVFGFIIVGAIIFALAKSGKNKMETQERLKKQYDIALRGKSKQAALDAGRAYYKHLRGWGQPLTIYDEQAIANDISTMSN